MTIAETILPEFDVEMQITRRVIERVPSDRGEWKPHEKSFSIGHLTQLVATMPGWLISIAKGENIDLAAGGRGYTYETTDNLLATFDKLVADARAVMAATSDEDYAKPWSLMMGKKVLITTPRGDTVRNTINHLIHHRGQLTVYLRLLDVPVPSVYGPTADEGWGA